VNLNSTTGTLSIIQRAVGAELPNWFMRTIVCLGLLLGMPIGVGLFVDYLADSVNSPIGFARDLGEVCLAAVPKSKALTPRRLRNDDGTLSLNEFRVMRSSLRLVWGQQAPRVIGIISGHGREGRSTVTLQLARALVEERRNAVILDADMRTVGMATKLGIQPKVGLLQVLSGEYTLDEAMIPIGGEVQLLPARAHEELVPANADLLFHGPRFRECIEQLKKRHDITLIDMPPLLEFPDAAEMLDNVEALVLVVNGVNRVRATETARACLDLLRHVDAKRLGIVVNQVLP
jgi:Mrp family chromosome partitioning ATPase